MRTRSPGGAECKQSVGRRGRTGHGRCMLWLSRWRSTLRAVRMTAALVGCLVLPGLGWARRLRLRDLGDTIALTVVLSLSITAVVATGMAVTGPWSPLGGLAVLAGIAVLGFLPVRSLVARAESVVLGGTALAPRPRPVTVDAGDTEDGWTDWYADARARSDEEQRRRAAEAEAAEQDWRDWYAETRLERQLGENGTSDEGWNSHRTSSPRGRD